VSDHLRVADDDGVRTITIDRPEVKNALTKAMRDRLCDLLSTAEHDAQVRVIVITAVDPVFTAGVDFKEVSQVGVAPADRHEQQFSNNPGRALRAMSKPVICAVNGACVSGGLEIALSSTLIVASERARFADTHARLGVVATWGLTALLPRAVGIRKASEMSITGNFVAADEALRIGLVNHVVAHDDLLPKTAKLAAEVATTGAVTEVLRLYRRGEDVSFAEALALEAEHTRHRTFDPAAFGAAGKATAERGSRGSRATS
jgi:enoyl-CoA hydratase